jgi:carbon-monoxide dehydrogenase large subunit
MTTEHTTNGLIGASIRRVEDPPLITGKGCYVDDIKLPGMLHMAVLRSPYAHAKIRSIDTSVAKKIKGVALVVTGPELPERLNINVSPAVRGQKIPPHPVLARGAVHAPGTPVVAVLAESRAIAQDGCNAIDVDYEPLPSVQNAEEALKPGAPLAREEFDSNISFIATKKGGDVEKAFAEAEHIVRMRIASPRLVALAMEPRGIAASPDPMGQILTVWLSTQRPHGARADISSIIGIPENKIHLIVPDVGGGFGSKGPVYAEYPLVCYLALSCAGRSNGRHAQRRHRHDDPGRDQVMTSGAGAQKTARCSGSRSGSSPISAAFHANTAGPPQRMMAMAPGCYRIQNCRVEVLGVFTNTVSTGPYRGAGRPESALNIERLIDKAAKDLGIDRLEIRRKNFIRPEQFPYRTGVGVEYDSGDYFKSLDEALKVSNYPELLRQRDERRARGEIVGVGLSTFVEPSGGAGFESGTARGRTRDITVLTGSSPMARARDHGRIAALMRTTMDRGGSARRHFRLAAGDRTFGSRSAVVGGGLTGAAQRSSTRPAHRRSPRRSGAGRFTTDGGLGGRSVCRRKVTWRRSRGAQAKFPRAWRSVGRKPASIRARRLGFGVTSPWSASSGNGKLNIEKLVLIDDCGVILNPMIVEGQIHGGVAQGLGEVLREQMLYGEDGQVLTGTLMNYAVMRAADMPPLTLGETVTPNPFHPLGVKGVGEAGTNGAPPSVANAVMDALAPLGIDHIDMPHRAEPWAAIRKAEGAIRGGEG